MIFVYPLAISQFHNTLFVLIFSPFAYTLYLFNYLSRDFVAGISICRLEEKIREGGNVEKKKERVMNKKSRVD